MEVELGGGEAVGQHVEPVSTTNFQASHILPIYMHHAMLIPIHIFHKCLPAEFIACTVLDDTVPADTSTVAVDVENAV